MSDVTDRFDNEVPPELDGVDIRHECPNCGDEDSAWIQRPAGYYTCPTCWSTWAGDPEDANIVDYCEHRSVAPGNEQSDGGSVE